MEKPTALDGEATEGLLLVRQEPLNAEVTADALVQPITVEPFVRCNFALPLLPAEHRLVITGAVERPFGITVEELRRLDQREVVMTYECAGNGRTLMSPLPPGEPWGEHALSTVTLRGVPLARVLERAGPKPGAREVRAEGADQGVPNGGNLPVSFARSLPLDKALDEDTLLALEMNGAPLTREHGAPVRLAVPGWFGMASVKWLTRLEVRTRPFEGWFQRQRYVYDYADDLPVEPVTELKPKSMIVSPGQQSTVRAEPMRIVGWAWSSSPLARVEISIDGGRFIEAALGPSLGRWAWRRFELPWTPPARGRHSLRARATDVRGETQPDWPRRNKHGYGNNAIRTVLVQVI